MKLVNGDKISQEILNYLQNFVSENRLNPQLDIIMVGSSQASKTYVNKKIIAGKFCGVIVNLHQFAEATDDVLIELIKSLNNDPRSNGIMLQLPAPNINVTKVVNIIDPQKDVDGMTYTNCGKIMHQIDDAIVPATVMAIIYVLNFIATQSGISLEQLLVGKNVNIINRSIIIGKPLLSYLLNQSCTVSTLHSKTPNLKSFTKSADIIISGTGKAHHISKDMLADNCILIDTGFSKIDDMVKGDISEDEVKDIASWLSPVPGGVGPIGVALLIYNTVYNNAKVNSVNNLIDYLEI
jgi:methylenetetrahydrofolate dehydrogenase (NADP+) / methenyltetrahydrofolate cyclohydrolase